MGLPGEPPEWRTPGLAVTLDRRDEMGAESARRPELCAEEAVFPSTAERPLGGAVIRMDTMIMTTRSLAFAGAMALTIFAFPLTASAQGVPRGAAQGADIGNRAAGAVGGVAGAVVGGVAGGVVGGAKGVVGIPQNTGIPNSRRHQHRR